MTILKITTFYIIMETGTNNLTNEELNDALDIYAFEKYCANCDHFPGDGMYEKRDYWGKCPYKNKFEEGILNGDTEWEQIGCKDFWD